MLPKPEKKTKNKTEQLNLTDPLTSAEKIQKKRSALILALSLTFGISLLFSAYRSLTSRQFSFSFPHINLPTSIVKSSSFEQQITSILSPYPQIKFYLRVDSSDSPVASHIQNLDQQLIDQNYPQILTDLQSQPESIDSLLKKQLPQGVTLRQKIIRQDQVQEIQYLINIPGKQILMIFSGPSSLISEEQSASLSEKIYYLTLNQSI